MESEMTEQSKLERMAEAVLFAAGESVSADQLSRALNQTPGECRRIVAALAEEYDREERGMQILELEGRYQMTTRPLYYEYVKTLYRSAQKIELTDTQMETLAIVAYKQPITKQEIEDIRGVRSEGVINRLIEFDLIEEVGRLRTPGRPILLGTTESFLRNFGLRSVKDLPGLPEEARERMEQIELSEDELPQKEE
jgi:segregation and condensation protein B